MNKAFTLIEVLIAVGILSIVAFGLLQVQSNNAKTILSMPEQLKNKDQFSLILLNMKPSYNLTSQNLYDILKTKFDITDQELINYLKNAKFDLHYDEFSSVNLLENLADIDGLDKSLIPDYKLLIDKVTSIGTNGTNVGYMVHLE